MKEILKKINGLILKNKRFSVFLAQENPLGGIKPPTGFPHTVQALGSLIGAIINLLIIAAGVITLIIVIIGGIQYATAGDDPKSTAAARSRVTAGIIGLAIVFSAVAIIKLIEFFFGIAILKFQLPSFRPGMGGLY